MRQVAPAGATMAPETALRTLARLYGVSPSYTDMERQRRDASDEGLLAVLKSLGASLESVADAPAALRERRLALHRRALPGCVVAFGETPPLLTLRLPAAAADRRVRVSIEPVDPMRDPGGAADAAESLTIDPAHGARHWHDLEGERRATVRVRLPHGLDPGYYRLRVDDSSASCPLLVAPRRMHPGPAALRDGRAWGVFLPVHAVRRAADAGVGDLDALGELFEWVTSLGGQAVGTLPMLAQFLDEPFEPSPYSPVSRLFWSELYLAPRRGGEPEAGSAPARGPEADAVRAAGEALVDYRSAGAERRRELEAWLAREWPEGNPEPEGLEAFRRLRPEVDAYARFRATGERRRESWHVWPERMRAGELRDGDWEPGARRFHLWAQWKAHEQLSALAERTRERGAGLYIDLPLGVHADGFDTWRYRDRFVSGMSVGAPPDSFFTGGQDWGFPPLRPEAMAESGFAYTVATIRNHLRYAGVLRLDHVMGLHRQYWVPHGTGAKHGVYVRYPARALYAILALESHARGAAIVGEDLGTVPPAVRQGMARHGVRGMYVGQFDANADARPATGTAAPGAVASLNTHDMPTFAAYWTGRDLRQRVEWGLLERDQVDAESAARSRLRQAIRRELGWHETRDDAVGGDDTRAALDAWQARLAAGDAALMLVNLEDLWDETEPQNVPGTWRELPNWRRRARLTLDEIRADGMLAERLKRIDGLRRGKA